MEWTLKYRSRVIIDGYSGWLYPEDKVLDIGCGNAVVTTELKNYFGLDMQGADVLDYRKRNIPFASIVNGKLPFEDKEFDVCMLNDTLHHCDNQTKILKEAKRVGGRILIFEMEPTILAKIVEVLINWYHEPRMNINFNIKPFNEWCLLFELLNWKYEYRKVKKPAWWYPFINFVFKI